MKHRQQPSSSRPRAAGYIRVSTGKQALSPEAQREKIKAMAGLQGVDLVELVTDRESAKEGSVRRRPGLLQILELAKAHQVERIIIAKLDRLTRSVVDLGEVLSLLDRHGISLVSATETWMDTGSAAGRMILNIVTSVAQWEREAIAERTAAVLQYKRSHNQVFNHTPYGFDRRGDRLIPAPAEQAIIRRIRKARATGKPLRLIAAALNEHAIPTKIAGGKWYASTVGNILRAAAGA